MLSVQMTPNLLGFEICGDYDELNRLYDAVSDVVGDEGQQGFSMSEAIMAERILALNYDLRHAYQGDRNVKYVDNGMDREKASWLGLGLPPLQNLVYSVEVLYPEAMYEVMGLRFLLERYQAKLLGKKSITSYESLDNRILYDPVCATVRQYQSLVVEALRKEATANTFARVRKLIGDEYKSVARVYGQWVDLLNVDWCNMTPAKRKSGLNTIIRDMVKCDDNWEYRKIKAGIDEYVRQEGVPRANVRLNMEYPEEYEW